MDYPKRAIFQHEACLPNTPIIDSRRSRCCRWVQEQRAVGTLKIRNWERRQPQCPHQTDSTTSAHRVRHLRHSSRQELSSVSNYPYWITRYTTHQAMRHVVISKLCPVTVVIRVNLLFRIEIGQSDLRLVGHPLLADTDAEWEGISCRSTKYVVQTTSCRA